MAFRADRHVQILIIGGGAIGTSLAYHLGCEGARDVLLVEKAQLTHGCTWHAAGLVGQLRGKRNLTRLMQNSVAVFDRLEAETGQAIEWRKVGSLRLASSPERWSEIRRSMTQAKSFGVECHALSAREAKGHFPYIAEDGIEGAAFIPGDGYVDPYALTMAYAKGARLRGVRIEEGVCVEEIAVEGSRVLGVITNAGAIGCDILVNCAGLWAKRVGAMAGVPLARRRRGRASVFPHREEAGFRQIPHDAPRSRQELLSQARYRCLRHWRLGGGHAQLLGRHAALGFRPRAFPAQYGAPRTLRAAGGRTSAGSE
jgi:glycine/D-amino acid oxidase-like deaminating enzyme